MSYQCETKDIEEFRDLWVFFIYVMALILWIYYFFSIQILWMEKYALYALRHL